MPKIDKITQDFPFKVTFLPTLFAVNNDLVKMKHWDMKGYTQCPNCKTWLKSTAPIKKCLCGMEIPDA